ncbi:MAG: MerR family transcriptional regulator [Gemmatimonadota bacterium]
MTETRASHSIGSVAERTGLTPALIRTWEERYAAVTPDRVESGHRRFSDAHVRRLQLLKTLVDAGHRIGSIAGLSDEELGEKAGGSGDSFVRLFGAGAAMDASEAIEALRALDRAAFRVTLEQAALKLGRVGMFDRFLAPLMREIGDRCQTGDLRMVHEHLATAEVRGFLDGVAGAFPPSPGAPALVVGTPAWQHHELGALLAAASGQAEGWRVIYLGPNLPSAELAAATIESSARALALSVTFTEEHERTLEELRAVRRLLPSHVDVVVGGNAAEELQPELDEIGIVLSPSLAAFREQLHRLREQPGEHAET